LSKVSSERYGAGSIKADVTQRIYLVKFGLNYRFDWGAGGRSLLIGALTKVRARVLRLLVGTARASLAALPRCRLDARIKASVLPLMRQCGRISIRFAGSRI